MDKESVAAPGDPESRQPTRTIDRLHKDGLIEFGVAVSDLEQSNPRLHALVQPFLATAVQRNLTAGKLLDLLLEHIQYDSDHPLYLWVMEVRVRLGFAQGEATPRPASTPSIEIVATANLVSGAAAESSTPVYRRSMPTTPDTDDGCDDIPSSERPTLIPDEFPPDKRR